MFTKKLRKGSGVVNSSILNIKYIDVNLKESLNDYILLPVEKEQGIRILH